MNTIQFLTKVGHTCTPIRQEFILLSDVLGVSALVDAHNNPPVKGATESSVLGPFFTEDAPDVEQGGSIASEGKGDYMYVEGRVLSTDGTPVPDAVIETWETDENGAFAHILTSHSLVYSCETRSLCQASMILNTSTVKPPTAEGVFIPIRMANTVIVLLSPCAIPSPQTCVRHLSLHSNVPDRRFFPSFLSGTCRRTAI